MADAASFIIIFPEFATVPSATPAAIDYWLSQALLQLAIGRLGASADLACYLFTAHNLSLSAQSANSTASGGVPGTSSGAITSKAANGLSVTFDTGNVAIAGAGEWNATSYGRRLWKLLEAFAMGGTYSSIPDRPHVYRGWPGGFPDGSGGLS